MWLIPSKFFPAVRDLKIRHNALVLDRRSLDNVVEETIYVTDVDAACVVAEPTHGVAYGKDKPEGDNTPAGVTRLAYADQLVEVSFTVALPC